MLCSHQPDSISPVASELTSHWSLYVATGKKTQCRERQGPNVGNPNLVRCWKNFALDTIWFGAIRLLAASSF